MVKFGKAIRAHAIPGWEVQYMNYKALKKIIKQCVGNKTTTPDMKTTITINAGMNSYIPDTVEDDLGFDSMDEQMDSNARFFMAVDRELEKVNAFFARKSSEYRTRVRLLKDKTSLLLEYRSNSGELISRMAIKSALLELQNDLTKLQNYVEMNQTGFRKILKKWDKQMKTATKELYLSRQVDATPCFDRDQLRDMAEFVSSALCRINGGISIKSDAVTSPDSETDTEWRHQKNLHLLLDGRTEELREKLRPSDLNSVFFKACGIENMTIETLVKLGNVDWNHIDELTGRNCIHRVALTGNFGLFQDLNKNFHVDPAKQDLTGKTPAHLAAIKGHYKILKELISVNVDYANIPDHDGVSPFMYAICNGHLECVTAFLDSGMDLSPYIKAPNNPICTACECGHTDIVKLLVERGIPTSASDSDGLFPLHIACRHGNPDMVNIILSQKTSSADIDRKDRYNGLQPIFYCAIDGHISCIKLLIEKGCIVEITDEKGWYPWTHALWNGHMEAAKLLEVVAISHNSPVFPPENVPELNLDVSASASFSLPALSLELPPPLLPLGRRRLVVGEINIKVHEVSLTGHLSDSSMKLTIHHIKKSDLYENDTELFTLLYPFGDEEFEYSFPLIPEEAFQLQFFIYPPFGNSLIGSAAISWKQFWSCFEKTSTNMFGQYFISTSVLDTRLHTIGTIDLKVSAILPFKYSFHHYDWVAEANSFERMLKKVGFSLDSEDFSVFEEQERYMGLAIDIKSDFKLSSLFETNLKLDRLLNFIFSSRFKGTDVILFSSIPYICFSLASKQTTLPIFFHCMWGKLNEQSSEALEGSSTLFSLKESTKFVRKSHINGIICESNWLIKEPRLLKEIRSSKIPISICGIQDGNVTAGVPNGLDGVFFTDHSIMKLRATL